MRKKKAVNRKISFKPFIIVAIIAGALILCMHYIIDFASLRRLPAETILLGKDSKFNLYSKIIEINPNTGNALIEFTLQEDMRSNEDIPNDSLDYFNLYISEGDVLWSGQSVAFLNQSSYNREFVRLQCTEPPIAMIKIYRANPVEIKITSTAGGYMFPFDSYSIRLNFALYNEIHEGIFPTIFVKSEEQQLYSTNAIRNLISQKGKTTEYPNSILSDFYRHNYVKINFILALILSFGIISWSFYRILSKHNVSGFEIIGLNVSLLISLPSLRESLIPSNLEYAPLYDLPQSLLWILSLLAILTYFIKDIRHKKQDNT